MKTNNRPDTGVLVYNGETAPLVKKNVTTGVPTVWKKRLLIWIIEIYSKETENNLKISKKSGKKKWKMWQFWTD